MAIDTSTLNQVNGTVATKSTGNVNNDPTQMSDQFLTLLVAQMKNQDPLNPVANSEFTSQIAQINTVSGINDLNTTLSAITGQIDTSQQLQASALVDKGVLIDGDEVVVGKDGTTVPFGIELARPADSVRVTISDASTGAVINQYDLGAVAAGVQSFHWNGQNSANEPVGEGNYRVSIDASSDGTAVEATPLRYALVSGVTSKEGSTALDLGPYIGSTPLAAIKQIL